MEDSISILGDPFLNLPNEMVEKILEHLPTTLLLQTCRVVNKFICTFASIACRRRMVQLNCEKLKSSASVKEILSTFCETQELPWSSCAIKLRPSIWMKGQTTLADGISLLEMGGQGILELEVEAEDYVTLIEILNKTPNLERLSVCYRRIRNRKRKIASPQVSNEGAAKFKLPRLKVLRFKGAVEKASMEFVQQIIQNSPSLERINFSIISPGFVSTQERLESAALLKIIPVTAIEFSINSSVLNLLLEASSKATEFTIKFPCNACESSRPQNFNLLERLLEITQHATHLSLQYPKQEAAREPWRRFPRPRFNPRFLEQVQIPVMQSLRILEFGKCNPDLEVPEEGEGEVDFPFSLFQELTSDQFPVLETVHIGPFNSTNGVFRATSFDSVKVLWVEPRDGNMLETEWEKVFPNLIELRAWVNEPSLMKIFTMTQLEVLHLSLQIQDTQFEVLRRLSLQIQPDRSTRHVNSILSGIANPQAVCAETEQRIQEILGTNGIPSLRSLIDLKELQLDFRSSITKLTDSGAYLALLRIQPLNYLCLKGAKISRACERRLAAHHQRFCNVAVECPNPSHDENPILVGQCPAACPKSRKERRF